MSRSADTTSFRCRSRIASSARWRAPPSSPSVRRRRPPGARIQSPSPQQPVVTVAQPRCNLAKRPSSPSDARGGREARRQRCTASGISGASGSESQRGRPRGAGRRQRNRPDDRAGHDRRRRRTGRRVPTRSSAPCCGAPTRRARRVRAGGSAQRRVRAAPCLRAGSAPRVEHQPPVPTTAPAAARTGRDAVDGGLPFPPARAKQRLRRVGRRLRRRRRRGAPPSLLLGTATI